MKSLSPRVHWLDLFSSLSSVLVNSIRGRATVNLFRIVNVVLHRQGLDSDIWSQPAQVRAVRTLDQLKQIVML